MHEHRLRGCAGSARGAHSHAPPVQPIHSTVRHARRARVQEGVGTSAPLSGDPSTWQTHWTNGKTRALSVALRAGKRAERTK